MYRRLYVLLVFCISTILVKGQTTQLNGVTLGPGVGKMLQNSRKSSQLILTYKSKAEAEEARKS